MSNDPVCADHFRAVRATYDGLRPGDKAALRRCREPAELLTEGAFWRLAGAAPAVAHDRLAGVVLCFAAAPQRKQRSPFRFGTFVRGRLHAHQRTLSPSDTLRFRRLLQARDRDELARRLRRLLTHLEAAVDWGTIGCDLYYWGERVQRRWAQDYYAPAHELDAQLPDKEAERV